MHKATNAQTYTHTHILTNVQTQAFTETHNYTYIHSPLYTKKCTETPKNTGKEKKTQRSIITQPTHTLIKAYRNTNIYTSIHTHKHTYHKYTQKHTHTNTTNTQTKSQKYTGTHKFIHGEKKPKIQRIKQKHINTHISQRV